MGIIEAILDEGPPSNVHYTPHHAVVHRGKSTTKVHVVYYASAKIANSPSLKDCLLQQFNHLILDILVQFCSY